jgi:hypothetical protein
LSEDKTVRMYPPSQLALIIHASLKEPNTTHQCTIPVVSFTKGDEI